jgi:hypothetical protein
VLLLPMPQAERRCGWARGALAAVTDGCPRKAVHSFFPYQPYLPPRVGTWNGPFHGFSVQSDYNNYLLPAALRDRKAKRPQDTFHFFACTETIYVAAHEHWDDVCPRPVLV